jgi:uncharacterized protein YjiS (DUF1127 family)
MHFWTRKYLEWRQRRTAIRKLHQLDNWILADLGVSRDAIARYVAGFDHCL